MNEAAAKKIYSRARFVAIKYGHTQEAEDIAQSVLLQFIKNPKSKQTVEHAVIDYLRQNDWKSRGKSRRFCLFNRAQQDDRFEIESIPAVFGSNGHGHESFERYLNCLKTEDRIITVLRYKWSLSESEIGYCFGISDSRVCQRIKSIHKRIQKEISEDSQTGISIPIAIACEQSEISEIKRTQISQRENKCMAQEKSIEMEIDSEARFDEWLT